VSAAFSRRSRQPILHGLNAREQLSRKLALLAAAFGIGLVILILSVSVIGSRTAVGIALAAILSVIAFGYHWFRCPHCNHSILHYTFREARAWFEGGPRHCPFCETELESSGSPATSTTS
jgi:hypothetical protein